jgi:hypothetical protein
MRKDLLQDPDVEIQAFHMRIEILNDQLEDDTTSLLGTVTDS